MIDLGIEERHYKFMDWIKCFEYTKSMMYKHGKNNVSLIISEHWATSGYWVEQTGTSTTLSESDHVYCGDDILRLFDRVTIAVKESGQTSPGLIL